MSRKSKGINAERDLVHLFWQAGWSAIRVAGSGSSPYPCPDVVAGNAQRCLAIECKSTESVYQYLTKEEVYQLKEFVTLFGAEPWIGVKFSRMPWCFMHIQEIPETSQHFVISKEDAKQRGLSFEQLLAHEQKVLFSKDNK